MEVKENCIPDFIQPSAVLYSIVVCRSVSDLEKSRTFDKIVVLHTVLDSIPGYRKMLSFVTHNIPVCVFYRDSLEQADTTFVIQGPDHENTLKAIVYSLPYGDVAIGIWEGEELEKAKALQKEKNYYNYCNCFFQIISTLKGLQKVTTAYAIKIRADEYFINYLPFFSKMKRLEPYQILTSNIYFRKILAYPYHISDHILGGRTENIRKMFMKSLQMIEESKSMKRTPEQLLTVSYIQSYKPLEANLSNMSYNDIATIYSEMVFFFDIFPIQEFQEFETKHYGNSMRKGSDLKGFVDINSMEELCRL